MPMACATEIVFVSCREGVVVAADKRAGYVHHKNKFNDNAMKLLLLDNVIVSGCGTTNFQGRASGDGKNRPIEIFDALSTGKQLIEHLPFQEISHHAAADWLAKNLERKFADRFRKCHEPLLVASVNPIFAVCWLKANANRREINYVIAEVKANHKEEDKRQFSAKYSGGRLYCNRLEHLFLGATSVKSQSGISDAHSLSKSEAVAYAKKELYNTYKNVKVMGNSITSLKADICIMRSTGKIEWIGKNISVVD